MKNTENNERQAGCFTWFIRLKKSANERWARARNALLRRFRRDNSRSVGPEDLVNETGCPDMIITKVRVTPVPVLDDGGCPGGPIHAKLDDDGSSLKHTNSLNDPVTIACDESGYPDQTQTRQFVANIINVATSEVRKERESDDQGIIQTSTEEQTVHTDDASLSSSIVSDLALKAVNASLTHIVNDMTDETRIVQVEDSCSMASSELSVIADAVVSDSLSRIVTDETEMAQLKTRTVTEVLENCNIDPAIGLQGNAMTSLPPCSP